ncbi:phosphomevalonate kinase [Nocardia sp. JMUB6875]|uniref:phosphomevalonate kinase n=1 Tax=Nocardia sp. JMUB6875 TaxID=3158170 RepID=UPI0032E5420C
MTGSADQGMEWARVRDGVITAHAPGKLFIAGEYAVVEPGYPAVVVAVDRCASVTVRQGETGDGVVLRSDLHGGIALRCTRKAHRLVPADGGDWRDSHFAAVLAAARVVERLAVEQGRSPMSLRLSVISRHLAAGDGRKFGLGSSAAVTVATVTAVSTCYGLNLSDMDRYRLAMLATIALNPNASGGDIAASTWGGWLAYQTPDRQQISDLLTRHGVSATVRSEWPRLRVRPLTTPRGLRLCVGWTGEPVSTTTMVTRARNTDWRKGRCYNDFLAASSSSVQLLIDAIEAGDIAAVQHQIRYSRRVLTALDTATGLGIMTPQLETLCTIAESVGAAAKPSGAGGGDCGIAILPHTPTHTHTDLNDSWTRAGIQPLPLHVQ